jgi:hypothetical protein
MILDGSQRGGAGDLAHHLMKSENEHIEVHEIRGFIAETIMGALREAEAVSRGTKCRKFLYSLSLSPPEMESVPVAAFEDAIQRIEAKLGLIGHPRIVVFHEKQGRRHAHCVWSRIDADSMKAVRVSYDRFKLGDISRELYFEHGWKMPEGLIDPALRSPLTFDRQEWFQAKRAGKDPRDIKAAFQQCWAASDSGQAFQAAFQQRGYYLARGDRRGVVAVDTRGEIYSVARWTGVTTKQVAARIGDPERLRPVAEVQNHVASLVQEKLTGFLGLAAEEFAQAAQTLEGKRLAMVEDHRRTRGALQASQNDRWIAEAKARANRFRKGLPGLWDRLTGKHAKLRQENEMETAACLERDASQRQALIETQLRERRDLQREIQDARRSHVRDVTWLHSEIAERRREVAGLQDDGTAPAPRRRRRARDLAPS